MANNPNPASSLPSPEGEPQRKSSNLPMLSGVAAALLAIVAVTIWFITRPGGEPGPVLPTPTPIATSVAVATAIPSTPFAGAATFTPVASGVITGPHVLGITAGVGMNRGEVAGAAPIAVTFSDDMDQASAQSAFGLSPQAQGDFKWQGNTLLFTPKAALQPSTPYTITVAADAKTKGGSLLATPMSASFKTADAPTILRTLPSIGASEVPTDVIVTVTFNRPMIPLTSLDSQPDPSQWVTISPQVAGRWVWLGTSAVGFRPDAANGFLPATDYTLNVKAGWPDVDGVALAQGSTATFTTIKPALQSVEPYNGSGEVQVDSALVVHFNMAMNHSTQANFSLNGQGGGSAISGIFEWSADSTVMTFTPSSLLSFSTDYNASFSQQVQPAVGNMSELAGGPQVNTWSFTTSDATHVDTHSPDSTNGPIPPTTSFGFTFNNPIAPNQAVAQFLTISPQPEGYNDQLTLSAMGAYTSGVKLKANTTYNFALKAGLKDKWGFNIPAATWSVQIGPLQPAIAIKGGTFQPIYSEAPTFVQLDATNLSNVTLHLNSLNPDQVRALVGRSVYAYDPTTTMPGSSVRQWQVQVPGGPKEDAATTFYTSISSDGNSDRLPTGYYLLWATAPNPYDATNQLYAATVLIVERNGVVTKTDGQGNMMLWVADLGTGKPTSGYNLRVEQLSTDYSGSDIKVNVLKSQTAQTGQDGVAKLKLDTVDNVSYVAIWSNGNDALFATTGWSNNLDASSYGINSSYGTTGIKASAYVDRPIYRPGQTVYFRAIYRLDDDAAYTLPAAGGTVGISAWTYNTQGQMMVYTGTATLSAAGTVSGQFILPVGAPTGSYTVAFSAPGATLDVNSYGLTTTSFSVEEYRKPDFQVNVTSNPDFIHGDPITATIQTSYYFGGPLQNMTTTVNLQASPYYFSWSDPKTGESYSFGEYTPPYYLYDYYYRPGVFPTPEPAQSFQATTDANGMLTADVTKYITTTTGSRSVLIEGQVQDLSNQAVANSTNTIVHQGQFYIGLRTSDYIATAKQVTTITVRTVDSSGLKITPNTSVNLRFVGREWVAPTDPNSDWTLNEIEVAKTIVTTDSDGRATYLFTPPSGGEYGLEATGTDGRGNLIRTTTQFYASDTTPGYYVPWRFQNDNALQLVADKTTYNVGDTAHILVTSPFTQSTALLTIERGHVRRYSVITLQGTAPTIDVPLEDGDLPNVYVSLTLLGAGQTPADVPQGWVNQVELRQGFVNISLDTSGKQISVSLQPQGIGPYKPGQTVPVKVTTLDKSGNPVQGDMSLAVVDEAIFALSGDNTPGLYTDFWGQRGLGVSTSTSFTSGDNNGYGRGGGGLIADGGYGYAGERPAAPMESAMPEADASAAASTAQAPSAPKTVRTDFRDTAFWTAEVATGSDGTATVQVPLPDNLTTWRLTVAGTTNNTLAGGTTQAITATQPLLLVPVLPRFLTTGDQPHPEAVIHNNTNNSLNVTASLEVSGSVAFDKAINTEQTLTVPAGQQAIVSWNVTTGAGDAANFRFWVRTTDLQGADYLEDAVAMSIPVTPFAAPEAVATSGEVSGVSGTESVMIPYSVNPLLGELTVQVSPSLAAATTDSLLYVKDYAYESTDQTVSRFLPLVTLQKVYSDQGLTTPYAQDIPDIVQKSVAHLRDLQQPDGGWAWWERGPSDWFETAYVVQGLSALREANSYNVDVTDMYNRGIEALRGFMQGNNTQGLDETYHLDMRAYGLYVLSYATSADQDMQREGSALALQTSRLSVHARAWLAMALGKMGMSESKQVLDSLVSSARQTSTLAHWEEGTPDYWSMGTDNRATALAIDALVTLQPSDPIIQKAVRWMMSAEREGHWLSTQETSIVLVSLAHYMQASKELSANYVFQVDAFGKLLGQGAANTTTLTQTTTFNLPVSQMPPNTLGDINLQRSNDSGKMYYQMSLKYYVPGEGIKSRSEGLAINRTYYKMTDGVAGTEPVKEANAGDLLKVRLSIVVPETSYYVQVTDPLPAGLEGVNGSLNTTSFTERPSNPAGIIEGSDSDNGYYSPWWRWGPFDNVEMRDTQTVLFASYMSPGTYVYEYYARATTPGTYLSLPAQAQLLYFPDVFGHSDGGEFTVK